MSDPTEGVGGSYVIDPATGKRQLVETTQPHPPAQPAQAPKAKKQPEKDD